MESHEFADYEFDDYVCPISSEIMQDPVLADDGRNYERKHILAWFKSCQGKKLPITSPWTRAVMSQRLESNSGLQSRIADAVQRKELVTGLEGIASLHSLNEIFVQLDTLRDILAKTLKGWQPPQVTVIGAESSGKSSLLQRLVMMPIFPTSEEICTRLPIHVRLRNSTQARAPMLEVFDMKSNRTVDGPFMVPIQSGALDIQEKMQEILRREQGNSKVVCNDRIIILHVQGPHVPSIDVVDMPGLIAVPPHAKEQTRALLERHVRQHDKVSMYIAVVPAGTRPNTSIAMEFVQAMGLESRTLGVLSKCDEVAVDKVLRLLQDPPDVRLGGFVLKPYGWYATMNAPIKLSDSESNSAMLRRQAKAELEFFEQRMPEGLAKGRASSGALIAGLSEMFLQHMRTGWVPTTMLLLDEALAENRRSNDKLGMPPLMGKSAVEVLRAKKLAVEAALKGIDAGYNNAGRECCMKVLEPIQQKLGSLVASWAAEMRADEAEEKWEKEKQQLLEVCLEGFKEWGCWWIVQVRRLVFNEQNGAPFVLGRFPQYVNAVVERSKAVIADAQAKAEAATKSAVSRFYQDGVSFTLNLRAMPASLKVQRNGGQLVQRVLLSFLTGSRGMLEGLMKAAADAASDVGDSGWVEACLGTRLELKERQSQIAAAKAGVERVLGAGVGYDRRDAAAAAAAAGGFGAAAPAAGQYGAAAPAAGRYGAAVSAAGQYGTAAPAAGRYDAGAWVAGGYATAPVAGGYGAGARVAGGYGATTASRSPNSSSTQPQGMLGQSPSGVSSFRFSWD